MKKTMFKGMALLSMGFAFIACSHDTVYDENFANKERVAQYNQAFKEAFGSYAPGHDWGFDETTTASVRTRGAIAPTKQEMNGNNAPAINFIVPEEVTSQKEGWSKVVEAKFKDNLGVDINDASLKQYRNFEFDNYWCQHINKADNGDHTSYKRFEAYDATTGAWITVTNFTGGQNNTNTYFAKKTKVKGTTLMVDMGNAGDPATGDSNGKLFRWIDNNGNPHYNYKFYQYEGAFFLGLEHNNHWWIILITKAEPKDETKKVVAEGRVMCEDMGTKADFDFNDVVFDAKIYESGVIEIEVLAAGGTLPISVAGQLVTLGKMKNTGEGAKVNSQKFTIDPVNGKPKWASIKEIPVVVNPDKVAESYVLGAGEDGAPQKICTYINTHWADEYQSIRNAYSLFDSWVRAKDPTLWIEVEDERYTDLDLTNN